MTVTALKRQATRPARGRPRCEAKNSAIMEAASKLFLEKGFEGTSMDEVARVAHVSKQTVYSHFESKEQLFSASVRHTIEGYFIDLDFHALHREGFLTGFRKLCLTYARLLLSEQATATFRLLCANAAMGGDLASIFWDSGPQEMLGRMIDELDYWVGEGALSIDDTEVAAGHLIGLLKGPLQFQLSIGLITAVTLGEIEAHVDSCLRMFLKAYSAENKR